MITKISTDTFSKNYSALVEVFLGRDYKSFKTEQDFIDVGIDKDFFDWAIANKFIRYWKKGKCYFVGMYQRCYSDSLSLSDVNKVLGMIGE